MNSAAFGEFRVPRGGMRRAASEESIFATRAHSSRKAEDEYTIPRLRPRVHAIDASADQPSSSKDGHENRTGEKVAEKRGNVKLFDLPEKKKRELLMKQWSAKTTRIGTLVPYARLNEIMKRHKPEDTVYKKIEAPDLLFADDLKMIKHVYEGISNETPEHWDAMTATMQKSKHRFYMDYVVSTEEREMGDEQFPDRVLIKWSKFPAPSWQSAKGFTNEDHQLRLLYLDFIENFLRHSMKDEFEKAYPCRYLKFESGRGNGGYVSNERSLYISKLRAIEYEFNLINLRCGLPPVYVEDWTDLPELDETLKMLQYIQNSLVSKEVKKLLNNRKDLEHMKCGEECKRGALSCENIRSTNASAPFCCGLNDTMQMKKGDLPRFLEPGEKLISTHKCLFRVECTDACGCDPKQCQNRVVQRGRQHPLVIFRDHQKEWTVRCVTEIKKGELVAEYCGQVQFGSSTGRAQQYDYCLDYEVKGPDGKEDPLIVCAFEKGNETRLLSHCCTPVCNCEATIVERAGVFYNHGVLRAARQTVRGEELTFDYFGKRKLMNADGTMLDVRRMFPMGCFCGSPGCRYTLEQIQEAERKVTNESKSREAPETPESVADENTDSREASSSLSGDPEKEQTPSSTADATLTAATTLIKNRMRTRAAAMRVASHGLFDDDTSSSDPSRNVSIERAVCEGPVDQPDDNNAQGSSSWSAAKCQAETRKRKMPQPARRAAPIEIAAVEDEKEDAPGHSGGSTARSTKRRRPEAPLILRREELSFDHLPDGILGDLQPRNNVEHMIGVTAFYQAIMNYRLAEYKRILEARSGAGNEQK